MAKNKPKEELKWVRECGGKSCEKCEKFEGRIYNSDQESEAKKKLHSGCQCAAYPVAKCNPERPINVESLEISNLKKEKVVGWRYTTISFSATVTNSGSVKLKDIEVNVEACVGGDLIFEELYKKDSLEPKESFDITGSCKINNLRATKLLLTAENNSSILISVSYTSEGQEEPIKKTNGCWN